MDAAGCKLHGAIFDISLTLGREAVDYPGDTPYSREQVPTGDLYELSKLVMSAHAGTHLDSPSHFLREGRSIDSYPMSRFVTRARVVGAKGRSVLASDLPSDVGDAQALLFKTTNSTSGLSKRGRFSENFVYMSIGAADACVELGLSLVGIDSVSVDRIGDEAYPVHRRLMEEDVLILEGLNLDEVPFGDYTLICLPLKIKGGEASPVRAVLIL